MSRIQGSLFQVKNTLNLRGNLVSLDMPRVMGILNVTPDSFYSGSRTTGLSNVLKKAESMIEAGALIIDVGGYSTRPGAVDIPVETEIRRVLAPVEALARHFPDVYVSIDTFRAEVAEAAVDAGACMVNDISGGNLDSKMFASVAKMKVAYVLMHMRGTPQTMKHLTTYNSLPVEVTAALSARHEKLKRLGVADVIIDPGFGFAKNIAQNYELLRNLAYFRRLKQPILAGLSRKSMIYKTLQTTPEEVLNGTTGLNMAALMNGASILRVHDVKQATETIKLFQAYKGVDIRI